MNHEYGPHREWDHYTTYFSILKRKYGQKDTPEIKGKEQVA